MEIVISDDCSSDSSWNIINSAVAAYRKRADAAEVVLNRNDSNLGNLGNWLAICRLSHGELLVKADGDDISRPDRCERIAAAWTADGKRATAISHGGSMIGPRGQRMGSMRRVSAAAPAGAVMAFSRRIHEFFGDAENLRMVDDELFALRARMLGPELVIPDRLVSYRVGTGVSNSLLGVREPMCRSRRYMIDTIHQARHDLDKVRARLPDAEFASWQEQLDAAEQKARSETMLFCGETIKERLAGFKQMGKAPLLSAWQYLKCSFLMPRPVGNAFLLAYAITRYAIRRMKGIMTWDA